MADPRLDVTIKTGAAPLATQARVFVSDDRCTLVDLWPDGTVTVATRNHPSEIWSPPTYLKEEK